MLDLRALRYFVHIARFGSVSRAAAYLRIAQPALSRQVRKLEAACGAALLVRHGRGVELTEGGRILLRRAEEILNAAEQARMEVAANADEPIGQITLAVTPSAGQVLVPPLMRAATEHFPKVVLKVVEGYTGIIHQGLLSGRFDLGVLGVQRDMSGLDMVPLMEEEMLVIGPPPGADFPPPPAAFRFSDLESLPMFLPSRPNFVRVLLDDIMLDQDVRLNVVREVDSVEISKALVKARLGYGILSYGSVFDDVARGELTATPVEPHVLTRLLVIATPSTQRPSLALTAVSDLIRRLVRELVQRGRWRGRLAMPQP